MMQANKDSFSPIATAVFAIFFAPFIVGLGVVLIDTFRHLVR